jgi:SAM-dependent methyltransferase
MHIQTHPSTWFVRHAALVEAGVSVLDVASGQGRHARFFAQRGARVTAVDRDAAALQLLAATAATPATANVTIDCRDIEGAPWPYAPESFDAVVVCNYLWRATFSSLLATITPGGVLLYETFMDGNERFGKPSRPDFLLRSNELLRLTQDAFRVVAFAEGEERDERDDAGEPFAVKQKIAAIKR